MDIEYCPFIDNFPIKNCDFQYPYVYQMVNLQYIMGRSGSTKVWGFPLSAKPRSFPWGSCPTSKVIFTCWSPFFLIKRLVVHMELWHDGSFGLWQSAHTIHKQFPTHFLTQLPQKHSKTSVTISGCWSQAIQTFFSQTGHTGTMVTCDPIIRSLVTLFYPVTCDPIIRSPATLSLYLHSPPCVPPSHGLHSTSIFKLPSPCVPLNHGLHSTSLFKLPPLRSTQHLSPFYFFI